jgi:N-acetylmuramoyl-L-alanine amidase
MKRKVNILLLYSMICGVFLICAGGVSKVADVWAESEPLPRIHTVIIDAGHGGEDGGATGVSGILESQLNLEISLRLRDLLHFLGNDTVMIRTADTAIYTEGNSLSQKKVSDLKQRVKIVNETPGGFLVSIHQNTFPDSRYSGAQVFYGAISGSKEFATQLQSSFAATINPGSNRKSKIAQGIYLMQHVEKPGVLIECGFLSSPEEEARLRTDSYQKSLCIVIASNVSSYLAS